MTLQSAILAGNARLEQAASGGPSVKRRPPGDEADAVRRIQNCPGGAGISAAELVPEWRRGGAGWPARQRNLPGGAEVPEAGVFPTTPSEWVGSARTRSPRWTGACPGRRAASPRRSRSSPAAWPRWPASPRVGGGRRPDSRSRAGRSPGRPWRASAPGASARPGSPPGHARARTGARPAVREYLRERAIDAAMSGVISRILAMSWWPRPAWSRGGASP